MFLPKGMDLRCVRASRVDIFVVLNVFRCFGDVIVVFGARFRIVAGCPIVVAGARFAANLSVAATAFLYVFVRRFDFNGDLFLPTALYRSLGVLAPCLVANVVLITSNVPIR